MLVGPVFSAGSVTSERERQTLELLLTTTLSPWQILCGQAALRPAGLLRADELSGLAAVAGLAAAALDLLARHASRSSATWRSSSLTSLTTTTLAMFCSVVFRKTSVSMMTTYLVLMLLFAAPLAAKLFGDVFFQGSGNEQKFVPGSSTAR